MRATFPKPAVADPFWMPVVHQHVRYHGRMSMGGYYEQQGISRNGDYYVLAVDIDVQVNEKGAQYFVKGYAVKIRDNHNLERWISVKHFEPSPFGAYQPSPTAVWHSECERAELAGVKTGQMIYCQIATSQYLTNGKMYKVQYMYAAFQGGGGADGAGGSHVPMVCVIDDQGDKDLYDLKAFRTSILDTSEVPV